MRACALSCSNKRVCSRELNVQAAEQQRFSHKAETAELLVKNMLAEPRCVSPSLSFHSKMTSESFLASSVILFVA